MAQSEYYDGETIRAGFLTEQSDLGKHVVTVLNKLVNILEAYYFMNRESIQQSTDDGMNPQLSFYSSVIYSLVMSVFGSAAKNITDDKSIRAKYIDEVMHEIRNRLDNVLLK